ncbi:MAG: hypothetical protein ABJF10_09650 [Chthoniobacter sp.]|uniref:hypothetical protein n=1 Tax=Chthoniobacter sp. TaxID=2510640 RepID=UPI0032A63740
MDNQSAADAPAGNAEKGVATQSQESKSTSSSPLCEESPARSKDALKGLGVLVALLVAGVVLWHFWRPLLCLSSFLGTWYAFASFSLQGKRSKVHSIGGGFILGLLALVLAVKLTGVGKNVAAPAEPKPDPVAAVNAETEKTTQPPAPESRSDGGPSDRIIRNSLSFFSEGKFKRGATLVSTGGRIPAGTLLFPVRPAFAPNDYNRFYFFLDEFGDWKLMWEQGESKVQILTPRKSEE